MLVMAMSSSRMGAWPHHWPRRWARIRQVSPRRSRYCTSGRASMAMEEAEAFMAAPRSHVVHRGRSEEHTSELQSHSDLVCRLLLEKKKNNVHSAYTDDMIRVTRV